MKIVWYIVLTAFIVTILASLAFGKEQYPGQYDGYPPEIRKWFQNYSNSILGYHCCGESDCHVDREWRPKGDSFEVFIPEVNDWRTVPAERLVTDKGNPTGSGVACYKVIANQVNFMCFTLGVLM